MFENNFIANYPQKLSSKSQRISSIQFNNQRSIVNTNQLFKPLPMKHHRREINGRVNNPRTSIKIDVINAPGNVHFVDTDNNCPNFGVQLFHNMKECKSNNNYFNGSSPFPNQNCQNQSFNAIRKVRSAGMYRPRFNQLNQKEYYTGTHEYFQSRGIDYENNLTDGKSFICKNNNSQTYRPIYNPNNTKFSTQGAVQSSHLLLKNKVNEINTVASSMVPVYGLNTANAMKYGVPNEGGITAKEKAGYPLTLTPIINNNGNIDECTYYVVRR